MRLTFKFATAGSSGVTQFPALPHDGAYYCGADGTLDYARATTDLARAGGVMMSDGDDLAVVAFTIELLERIHLTFANWVREHTDEASITNVLAKSPATRSTADRRLIKGRVTFVRIDIRRNADALRVALDYANPRNVVGDAEEFAAIVAQAFADILVALEADIAEQGTRIRFVEGANCGGMFARARQREQARADHAQYGACPNRKGCYCSPSQFACKFYKDGRCAYTEVSC